MMFIWENPFHITNIFIPNLSWQRINQPSEPNMNLQIKNELWSSV